MAMRFSPLFAAAAVAAVSAPAFAQPPAKAAPAAKPTDYDRQLAALFAPGGLTADAAAQRARSVSPDVKRKAADRAGALSQRETVDLAYVPRLSAKARYTRLSNIDQEPLTLPGPRGMPISIQFPDPLLNSYSLGADLSVPVSDYLLRFPQLKAAASAGEKVAAFAEQASELGAANDARIYYYEWVRARLQVVVAEQTVAQVDRTLQQVSALADVQRASRADLLRITALKAQAELGLSQAREVAALREDQLRIAIGARADEALTIGEDVRNDLAVPQLDGAPALADAAMTRRYEARAIDSAIEATRSQRKAAGAGKLPRLDAFAQAGYDNPSQRVFPQEDKFTFTWAAGAQLSWSFNDFLGAAPQQDSSDAQARGLRADRERLAYGVRLEVLAASQQVALAQEALTTTAQGLTAAEEGYRVRKELFAAERATTVELIDAESELTRARIAAIDARINLRVALAKLAHAAGLDVK